MSISEGQCTYVTSFDDEAGENRLRWFGNVQRKRTLR